MFLNIILKPFRMALLAVFQKKAIQVLRGRIIFLDLLFFSPHDKLWFFQLKILKNFNYLDGV